MIKSNLVKFLSLFFITIAAQILLSMIEGQIEDRSNNRHHAREAIKKSWTGDQTLLASVLTIPFERAKEIRIFDKELNRYVAKVNWIKDETFILPKLINIDASLKHQVLSKGIYQVPVYTSTIKLVALFVRDRLIEMAKDPKIRLSKTAFLSFGVRDTRGITGSPSIRFDKKELTVLPGTQLDFFLSGFHSEVSIKNMKEPLAFDVDMQVKGMGRIAFIATARENSVTIQSEWPHPSFDGAFLPISRKISDQGYTASWKTGIFSTDIENTIEQCFDDHCDDIYASSFGVNHIQAVDIYLKSLRSIKYGILVLIITFTIFILYEVLNKRIRIHPVSYSLTGMALSIFFLLLIALSEHINFESAYWISSFSCSGLIAYYVSQLSHSKRHGGIMFGLLNGFYLILFFIIRSEDHALLSGSLLLFILLAVVMVVTRKVDWYQLASKN